MRVKVWGCRGSIASPGPETVRYGGNTAFVEVRLASGAVLVLDAGTGIRALGDELAAQGVREIHVMLSHLHLDHLVGLGFFAPMFIPGVAMHLWGPRSPVETLEERIVRYLSPPLFPVHLSDAGATLELHEVPEGTWTIGSATVRADSISHSGPTLGYRIEEGGASFSYLPDHEPARGTDLDTESPEWISGYRLMRGADLAMHDAQYSEEEYVGRVGWGHSSISQVVTVARRAGVKQLVLFHHDPMHSDARLEEMEARAAVLWGADNGPPPVLARELSSFELGTPAAIPGIA